MLMATLLTGFSFNHACAEEEFIDVGGKSVKLGKLVFPVPSGWVRAPLDVEKEEGGYLLGYEQEGELSTIVKIEYEADEIANEAKFKKFLAIIKKDLTKQGWKAGRIRLDGYSLPAFLTYPDDDGGRLYMVLVPYENRHYRFYVNVFTPGKKIPGYVNELLLSVVKGPGGGRPDYTPAFADVMTRDEIQVSNILYGGDIAEYIPIGRETKKWHSTIVAALEQSFSEMDRAYDQLIEANRLFDGAVFDLHQKLKNNYPKLELLNEEEARLELLTRIMMMESSLHEGIGELRSQLKAEGHAALQTRQGSHLRLLLLGMYSKVAEVQAVRGKEIFSFYTAAHHTKLGGLTNGMRSKFAREIRREKEAIIKALAAESALLAGEYATATGLTGIKDIFRLSLDMNIDHLENEIARVEKQVADWDAPQKMRIEKSLFKDTLYLYREQLKDLKNAKKILDSDSKVWPGLITTPDLAGIEYPDQNFNSWSTVKYVQPSIVPASYKPGGQIAPAVYQPGSSSGLILTAKKKASTNQGSRGFLLAGKYAQACNDALKMKKKPGFFSKAFKAVCNTVGRATNTISLGTKAAADKYYSWSLGLSKKDELAQVRQTIKEHMEEYERGEIGKKSMRQAINSFTAFENGADDLAAKGVSKVVGKGWLSWGAGKLANAAASTFTGLAKGVVQTTAHDATPGERVEGVINVAASLVGVSSNASKPLTKSAGKAVGKVASKAQNALKQIVRGNSDIAFEKSIGKLLGPKAMAESKKKIAQIISKQQNSMMKLKDAITGGIKKIAEGGAKALSPGNFTKGAKKALGEAVKKGSLKETAKKMSGKLAGDSLVHGALDNAIAGKAGKATNNLLKVEKKTPDTPARKKKRKEKSKIKKLTDEADKWGDDKKDNEDDEDEEEEGEEDIKKDEEQIEEPSTAQQYKILEFVTPQKVTAAGTLSVPTPGPKGKMDMVTVRVLITFWNVGRLGGGQYSGATMKYRASSHGAIESRTMNGTFSGGPNGVIDLEDVSLKVSGGAKVTIPEMGTVPLLNPGAFADWPRN